jgi:hypothetical protein
MLLHERAALTAPQELQQQFVGWMAAHGRTYAGTEQRRRQDTFRSNARLGLLAVPSVFLFEMLCFASPGYACF